MPWRWTRTVLSTLLLYSYVVQKTLLLPKDKRVGCLVATRILLLVRMLLHE